MLSLLFPWFITAICLNESTLLPDQLFGPFETREDAAVVTYFLTHGLVCATLEPERKWRWTTAVPIYIPPEFQPTRRP